MIRLAIRRPVAVAMAYLCIGVLGFAAWRNIPIELLPETELPRLTVRASWPGASPETTEAFLTAQLEAAIQQVRGTERITSESFEQYGQGISAIEVEFARETDMDFARLELSERLAAIEDQLPPGAFRPTIAQYVPEEFQDQRRPFLAYTVTGPYTLEALRAYVDESLAPEVRQVDGVGAVLADGGRDRLLEIELDERRTEALGLSPEAVRQRIWGLEIVRQAGRVDRAGVLHTLALRQRAETAADVRRTPLLTDGGRIVRLEDVAVVRETFEEPRSFYRIDGQPAVSFTVFKETGTNAVAVADAVKSRIDELGGAHPAGVRLILDEDESEAIRAQLDDLRTRALAAALVIFVVLLLFLRSWRSAGIVFATIAFSVLITLNLVYWTGHTLNVLTLMGLAMGFGLIVDNAIVVLENVYRHRQGGASAEAASEAGAREVVLPVLAATLTTLVVMVPFVYLQGELQVFYVPLAMVVGFSLLGSLFVAFSFIPALGARVLRGGRPRGGSPERAAGADRAPGVEWVTEAAGSTDSVGVTDRSGAGRGRWYIRLYAGLTGWTLRYPRTTVLLAVVALGGSFHLFDKYVNRGVVWASWGSGSTYLDVRITLPRGEELARTDELVRDFEARISAMPEVERFVSRVSPQYAQIRITFPDSLETTAVPVVIKEQMTAYSFGFGGAQVWVIGYGPSYYSGGSSPPNYAIQVRGYNYERVREISEDLGRRLLRFSRIQDVDTNASGQWFQRDRATELVLRLDRERLAMRGITAREVVGRVRSAVAGSEGRTSVMRLGGEEMGFSVKLEGHDRIDGLALEELLLPASSGAGVRLGDVATLEEREVQARIRREDQQYQRTVAYEFRGPTKLGDAIRDAVLASTSLPPGYTVEVSDRWGWSVQEKRQIYGVLIVALLLVFMVTAALFESLRQPAVVLLTVPMALIGVFLIFFYTGASFTREAYVGVIMMGGIVVNNAILLVDHVNGVRRRGDLTLEEAVLKGTMERVRPILMTTTTTVLGLLPLVLFSDYADENIWNALGYALIGGLTSSTLLVLTVTPALYLLAERRAERKRVAKPARDRSVRMPADALAVHRSG